MCGWAFLYARESTKFQAPPEAFIRPMTPGASLRDDRRLSLETVRPVKGYTVLGSYDETLQQREALVQRYCAFYDLFKGVHLLLTNDYDISEKRSRRRPF